MKKLLVTLAAAMVCGAIYAKTIRMTELGVSMELPETAVQVNGGDLIPYFYYCGTQGANVNVLAQPAFGKTITQFKEDSLAGYKAMNATVKKCEVNTADNSMYTEVVMNVGMAATIYQKVYLYNSKFVIVTATSITESDKAAMKKVALSVKKL